MGTPSPELVQAVAQQATAAGIDPATLMAVIGYETAGTYDPNIWGGKGGNYFGLIQFGPNERSTYGVYPGMPVDRQVGAAISFLLDRGFDPSRHGLLDMYSTINAGSPGHYGRSDGNGTVRSHAANIEAQYLPAAQRYVQDAAPSRAYAGLPDGRANMAPLRGLDEVRAPPIPVSNPSRMAYAEAPARSALESAFAPLLAGGVERVATGRVGHWADALARPPAPVPYQPGTAPMGRPGVAIAETSERFQYPVRNVVPYNPNPPAPSAAETQRMVRDTAGSLPAKEGISRADFNGRYFGNAPLLNPDRSRMPNLPERSPIPLQTIDVVPRSRMPEGMTEAAFAKQSYERMAPVIARNDPAYAAPSRGIGMTQPELAVRFGPVPQSRPAPAPPSFTAAQLDAISRGLGFGPTKAAAPSTAAPMMARPLEIPRSPVERIVPMVAQPRQPTAQEILLAALTRSGGRAGPPQMVPQQQPARGGLWSNLTHGITTAVRGGAAAINSGFSGMPSVPSSTPAPAIAFMGGAGPAYTGLDPHEFAFSGGRFG